MTAGKEPIPWEFRYTKEWRKGICIITLNLHN